MTPQKIPVLYSPPWSTIAASNSVVSAPPGPRKKQRLPMSVPLYKAHYVPLPGFYPPVLHQPPLLDVHIDDATEVQSVLSQSEAETVISHPAPRPVHLDPGSSIASASKRSSASSKRSSGSKHSSASQRSASFRSVDALAIKPCMDYSQYGPWLYGQFSDCLLKGVQYLVGPSLLNINSPIQESIYRITYPQGFLNLLGPKLYDENLAELTELSMISSFLHRTKLPCPFTAYLTFRSNHYSLYSGEFINSDLLVTLQPVCHHPSRAPSPRQATSPRTVPAILGILPASPRHQVTILDHPLTRRPALSAERLASRSLTMSLKHTAAVSLNCPLTGLPRHPNRHV